jgi:DNA-binding GntR family transcriptional regulator
VIGGARALVPIRAMEGTVRDQVRNALRAAIISGELVPGELYPAPALGAQLGVSSTPVREAMFDLVTEGLVVVQPNKGFRVTEMSDADLDNVAAVRMLVEPPATRDVVPLIPDAGFVGLRALADPIVTAADVGDLVSYVEADRVFHLTLLGYSGNPHLLDVVARLRAQTRLSGLARLAAEGKLVESAAEHHELLDLAETGDAVGAESLMRRHIDHIRAEWS